MAVPYKEQWATLMVNFAGDAAFTDKEIVDIFKALLMNEYTTPQMPVIERKALAIKTAEGLEKGLFEIAQGPFAGAVTNGPILNAFKWNLRRKDGAKTTLDNTGALRAQLRETGYMGLSIARGGDFTILNSSVKPYGGPLTGDPGFPKVPALPAEPAPKPKPTPTPGETPVAKAKSPWGWVIAALGLLAALKRG